MRPTSVDPDATPFDRFAPFYDDDYRAYDDDLDALAMLAAERGAAINTLAAYRRDLEGAEAALGDLTQVDGAALAVELLTKSVCHLGIGLRYVLQCHANDSFDDCHFQRSGRVVYE